MLGPASLDDWIQAVMEKQRSIHTRLEWMQFTGLTDKNGIEIYEGDILASKLHLNESDITIYPVQWGDENARFQINGFEISLFDEVEVIGNIFENPELISN